MSDTGSPSSGQALSRLGMPRNAFQLQSGQDGLPPGSGHHWLGPSRLQGELERAGQIIE